MESIVQDLRQAVRSLLARPGFTIVAVLTLALGIGANSAIFSVVNSALLRPLPFREPDRLVVFMEKTADGPRWTPYANFLDYREQSDSFESLSVFVPQSVNLTGQAEPDRVRGGFVSANFFDVLGMTPGQGRHFRAGEDEPGAERVAVVDHAAWQRRFGADPGLVGRTLVLNGEPFTVVGIAPEAMKMPFDEIEVWIPAQHYPNYSLERNSGAYGLFGRLAPGVSREQAEAELGAIAARLAETYPQTNRVVGVQIKGFHDSLVDGTTRPMLLLLLGVVGFVLLITCANLANLIFVRNLSRLRTLAVRAALGASRARLLRLLLAETVLLGLVGGLVGLVVALWGVEFLREANPVSLPEVFRPALDARVFGFTLGVSLLAGLLFGAVPAIQLSRPDLQIELKEGGQRAGDGRGRRRTRGAFVVAQVALSLVLLAGTGLCIRSFAALLGESPGFRPERLLSMEYRLPSNRYGEAAQQVAFHRQVLERARAVPGVESVAYVRGLPFSGNGGSTAFTLPERPSPDGSELRAGINAVSPEYFATMGIPLLAGRALAEADGPESLPVVVVNDAMARRYWPGEDPIGRQVKFSSPDITATVVGVVGNTKQFGLDEELNPQIFTSYAQNPAIFATLVARTSVDPMSLATAVRGAVWAVDPDQPVWKIRSVESLIDRDLGTPRSLMLMMAVFAAVALLLTALGIFGVASSSVTQRTHEIGVRLALGAQRGDVLRLMLGQGLVLALVGGAIGVVAALGLSRYLESLVFGVSTSDPLTFAAASVVLLAIAALATYLPARRATRIDPIEALRYE
jgi:putative ABC transport system permease protein